MHDNDHGKANYTGNGLHFRANARLDPSQVEDRRHFPGFGRVVGMRPPASPYLPPRPSQVRIKRPRNG